jgi:hypothetical protein
MNRSANANIVNISDAKRNSRMLFRHLAPDGRARGLEQRLAESLQVAHASGALPPSARCCRANTRRRRANAWPCWLAKMRRRSGSTDRGRYSAAVRISAFSARTAQNLNSGILPNGSSAGLVSRLAAASA